MAAGCLVIGNIPVDRSDSFSKHIINISSTDSDESILQVVKFWLDPKQAEVKHGHPILNSEPVRLTQYRRERRGSKRPRCGFRATLRSGIMSMRFPNI